MNTTPLWVPLLVAALGVVSTFVGIIVTQVMAKRRERATWQRELEREQARWQREDERERARWEREDQAMTFEHRRAAYVEFYESLRKMQDRVYMHGSGNPWGDHDPDLEEDWPLDAWEKLQLLELYATPRVSSLATEAFSATSRWGQAAHYGRRDETFDNNRDTSDEAKIALREAIRADLGVPD